MSRRSVGRLENIVRQYSLSNDRRGTDAVESMGTDPMDERSHEGTVSRFLAATC